MWQTLFWVQIIENNSTFYWNAPLIKTSTVYWSMSSNLKALPNSFLNEKNPFMCGLSVCKICTIFMHRICFIIVQFFRPWQRHNRLRNLIRVLHCMVNSNSYVRIRVKMWMFRINVWVSPHQLRNVDRKIATNCTRSTSRKCTIQSWI